MTRRCVIRRLRVASGLVVPMILLVLLTVAALGRHNSHWYDVNVFQLFHRALILRAKQFSRTTEATVFLHALKNHRRNCMRYDQLRIFSQPGATNDRKVFASIPIDCRHGNAAWHFQRLGGHRRGRQASRLQLH